MAFNLANNPFMMGYLQEQTSRSDRAAEVAKADEEKRRQELIASFDNDMKVVRENLSRATDPKQREAIQQVLAAMKDAYTGSEAAKFGLDKQFGRSIELSMQTPVESQSSSLGTFGSLLEGSGATEEQKKKLMLDRAGTLARGGSEPYMTAESKELGKGAGSYASSLEQAGQEIPIQLQQLQLVENALSDAVQGPIIGKYTPDISTSSQLINSQSTKDALGYVNQTKGAVSDREMAMFKSASIGTDKNEDFNRTYINIAKAILARKSQQADFFGMWRQYYGTTNGAFEAFKKYAEDNPLFTINGTSAKLNKPVDDILSDTSWQSYIGNDNQGGGVLPPVPPVNMDSSGEITGGMPPPPSQSSQSQKIKFLGFE